MTGARAVRRFWRKVHVVEESPGTWGVRLDGRVLATPLQTPLRVPSAALARALAAEWRAQGETVDQRAMPTTRACHAALDKVATNRDDVVQTLIAYGASDLLCYRALDPAGLVARQASVWDPLLEWAATAHGARLRVTRGVVPVSQPAPALAALAGSVRARDVFALAALHQFVALSGSLVIGLAASEAAFSLVDLWDAARLDEEWQAAIWGLDRDAQADARARREAFFQAGRFQALLAT